MMKTMKPKRKTRLPPERNTPRDRRSPSRSTLHGSTWFALAVILAGAGCSGGSSVPPEPVAECLEYERAVADCYHRKVAIANDPSLIPHSPAELVQIRGVCRENLDRFKVACR
jgi:hypothetical protein